jgi:hypothetical protein
MPLGTEQTASAGMRSGLARTPRGRTPLLPAVEPSSTPPSAPSRTGPVDEAFTAPRLSMRPITGLSLENRKNDVQTVPLRRASGPTDRRLEVMPLQVRAVRGQAARKVTLRVPRRSGRRNRPWRPLRAASRPQLRPRDSALDRSRSRHPAMSPSKIRPTTSAFRLITGEPEIAADDVVGGGDIERLVEVKCAAIQLSGKRNGSAPVARAYAPPKVVIGPLSLPSCC